MGFWKKLFGPSESTKVNTFNFGDDVKVTAGFYEGLTGKVVRDTTFINNFSGLHVQYLVKTKHGLINVLSDFLQATN